jgi:PAS domain-containing protein
MNRSAGLEIAERIARKLGVRDMPDGLLREPLWIDTDYVGHILAWHPDATALLGYVPPAAGCSQVLPFLFIKGRPFPSELDAAARGRAIDIDGTIRPRDRRGIPVRCRIERGPTYSNEQPVLRWIFVRVEDFDDTVWR